MVKVKQLTRHHTPLNLHTLENTKLNLATPPPAGSLTRVTSASGRKLSVREKVAHKQAKTPELNRVGKEVKEIKSSINELQGMIGVQLLVHGFFDVRRRPAWIELEQVVDHVVEQKRGEMTRGDVVKYLKAFDSENEFDPRGGKKACNANAWLRIEGSGEGGEEFKKIFLNPNPELGCLEWRKKSGEKIAALRQRLVELDKEKDSLFMVD